MDIMKLAEKAGFEVVDEKLQLYYDGDKIILKPNLMGTVTDGLKEFTVLVRAEALEEAAKVCDAIEEDHWNLYKGRKPYTGSEAGRADPHEQGASMGAEECAAAIRGLK